MKIQVANSKSKYKIVDIKKNDQGKKVQIRNLIST